MLIFRCFIISYKIGFVDIRSGNQLETTDGTDTVRSFGIECLLNKCLAGNVDRILKSTFICFSVAYILMVIRISTEPLKDNLKSSFSVMRCKLLFDPSKYNIKCYRNQNSRNSTCEDLLIIECNKSLEY